jgi:tetratricopeptide (TPR) repeat protein
MLGIVAAVYDYDWTEAGGQFALAMARTPVPTQVRGWYALFYLLPTGRLHEALKEGAQALREDPLNIPCYSTMAFCLQADNRFDEAEIEFRKGLELVSNHAGFYSGLGLNYALRGMYPEALACAEKSYSLAPYYMAAIGLLAGLLVRTVDKKRAGELLQKLGYGEAYGVPNAFVAYHLLCGEVEKAVDWVEKAIEQRQPSIAMFTVHPMMKVLQSSSRWPALMKRLNLPEVPAL